MILIRSFPESFSWKLKLAPLPRPNREGGFHQMSLPITKNVTFEKVLVLANVLTFCNGSPISSRVVTLRHDISELRWSYTTNLGSKLSRKIISFICNQPEASRRPTEREIPNVLKICPEWNFIAPSSLIQLYSCSPNPLSPPVPGPRAAPSLDCYGTCR